MRITSGDKPYRVRCLPKWSTGGWMVGFDSAALAAEYMRKSIRLGNITVTATRPGRRNGERQWVTMQGLRQIVAADRRKATA